MEEFSFEVECGMAEERPVTGEDEGDIAEVDHGKGEVGEGGEERSPAGVGAMDVVCGETEKVGKARGKAFIQRPERFVDVGGEDQVEVSTTGAVEETQKASMGEGMPTGVNIGAGDDFHVKLRVAKEHFSEEGFKFKSVPESENANGGGDGGHT